MSEQDKHLIYSQMINRQPDDSDSKAADLSQPDPSAAQTALGITQYLSEFEGDKAIKMRALREFLNHYESDMTEGISWGMPTFKYKGSNVFGFAAAKNHLGIYPGSEAIDAFKELLDGYPSTKGSIHLSWEDPLPESLIRQILLFNIDRVNQTKG